MEIRTVSHLLKAAAAALAERDSDKLFDLRQTARSWLQDFESTDAQVELLESMMEAAESLAQFEAEDADL